MEVTAAATLQCVGSVESTAAATLQCSDRVEGTATATVGESGPKQRPEGGVCPGPAGRGCSLPEIDERIKGSNSSSSRPCRSPAPILHYAVAFDR